MFKKLFNLRKKQKSDAPPKTATKKPISPTVDTSPKDRIVVVDVETTGLDPNANGHRIVTFAGVEIENNNPTNSVVYLIFNPERPSDHRAREVHGFDSYTLAHQDKFKQHAQALRDFLGDAKIVAHNANFDVSFLNAEFKRAGVYAIDKKQVQCTMKMFDTWCKEHGKQPTSLSLDFVNQVFEFSDLRGKEHNALDDALLCAQAYLTLKEGYIRKLNFTESLPPKNFRTPPQPVKRNARDVTAKMVEDALERYGTKSAAAKSLGISQSTVNSRLKKRA